VYSLLDFTIALMPTMPMRVDPYARTPAKLSKTGKTFALVFALHVGLLMFAQSLWQLHSPAPLRAVVTAALLPMIQDAPVPAPVTPPTTLRQPEPLKMPPAPQATPVQPSQMPAPAQQAPSALPAITVAPAVVAMPAPTAPATPAPVALALPVRPPVVVAAAARMDSCAKPRYPVASERLHEEGVVSLKFLISENGQVLSGSVEKSSGYKRLDDAALAALTLCKFRPATVDGKPRQEWSALRYRWELND
jgi:periplasmic protein TonB